MLDFSLHAIRAISLTHFLRAASWVVHERPQQQQQQQNGRKIKQKPQWGAQKNKRSTHEKRDGFG